MPTLAPAAIPTPALTIAMTRAWTSPRNGRAILLGVGECPACRGRKRAHTCTRSEREAPLGCPACRGLKRAHTCTRSEREANKLVEASKPTSAAGHVQCTRNPLCVKPNKHPGHCKERGQRYAVPLTLTLTSTPILPLDARYLVST